MRSRHALSMLLGLLVGVVAGPVLWGVASSLFWSMTADGNDPQRVASLLYNRTQVDPAREAFARHVTLNQCGEHVSRLARPGDLVLMNALAAYSRRLLRSKYDELAARSLEALPTPILGALNGCVGGSPASGLCLAYVHDVVAKATTIPSAMERAWLADIDGQIELAMCIADPR
ncbi:hypothetical protein [uncultured Sphingomonas sp.]|uniref:hypothetical protein n=1 Tax=uncultured Sphingomonas sp. TaxID=158754 RepID=UPI0025D664CB|nr:hypothetical protein [uncultured Sphingomonas sp.]